MIEETTIKNSLSFKKNSIDDLFLNLTENPECFKKKDFRFFLSFMYQLFEDEFEDTYNSPHPPLRNTDFYVLYENGKFSFFITPTNNFEFYLKSKGSLYRFSEVEKEVKGEIKNGYLVPFNVILEYFMGFKDVYDFDYLTESFKFFNQFTNFALKSIEKLYFVPTVKFFKNTFKIHYDLYLANKDLIRAKDDLKQIFEKSFVLKNELTTSLFEKLLSDSINHIIYNFLFIKNSKFKDFKAAMYFTKNVEHSRFVRGTDCAESISEWFDEFYLGKYEYIPVFKITKKDKESFDLEIDIKNNNTNKVISLKDLEEMDENDSDTIYITEIIQKQINYSFKYFPKLEELFNNKDLKLKLNLTEVYEIITQTAYYLQKAGVEVSLPDDLSQIVIPRASINAKVKSNRAREFQEALLTNTKSTINIEDLLDFSYEVSIGDQKVTPEEFERLSNQANGLILYKNQYILINQEEAQKILKNLHKPPKLPSSQLELIQATLSGNFGEFEFNYDAAFQKIIQELGKIEDIQISKDFIGELRPYQETGLKWLWTNTKNGFGCCMADDMGLGKTIQVISLLLKLKEENKLKTPVLVVCPTTLVGNWVKELNSFAPTLKVSVFQGPNRELDLKTDVVITTYSILRIDIEKIKKTTWSVLTIDEAQYIKNPDTSQTNAVKSLKSNIKIAMTGTPVENRLTELWSIFDFINKGYLGSLRDFQKSYSIPIEKFKEYQRAEKLKLSVSPFILRRLKTDKNVISDLPEKVVLNDYCYLSKQQAALYEKTLNDIMGKISLTKGINRRGMIFKLITALKQICNHPAHYLKNGDISKELSGKCEKLVSTVESIIQNKEKVLIFTQYKEMGFILQNILNDEFGDKSLFFHGSLNTKQREEILETFDNDDSKQILIISLKAGGTGLNLTKATNVIHYDLWWNPAVEEQATDRTYRIGQDKNVMVHRLITIGTFEEKIDEMIKSKKELANLAVFEGEKILTELSDEEIYNIFTLAG